MSLHIVLFQPEIPANTGNIGRTCLATDTQLHLIHPLGFSTDDKMLKRAGLDYWQHLKVQEYLSMEELYRNFPEGEFYYIENFGTKHYSDFDFNQPDKELFFVFGSESSGIPRELLQGKEDRCLRIHMNDKVRSLNLSNTAAIIVYEALRQQRFLHLK